MRGPCAWCGSSHDASRDVPAVGRVRTARYSGMTIPAARLSGFTSSTSVPLYWREDGPADAPPLLLLHGGPGAHHDYLYPQMLALAERHRLVTYDQRGGGQSRTDDPAPITWQTQVADLQA